MCLTDVMPGRMPPHAMGSVGSTCVSRQPAGTEPSTAVSSSSSSSCTRCFFAFICLSIALRSFEAGIVSSMMSAIKSSLDFDYTSQGSVAASPDYGIAPGSIIAIFVFRRFKNAKSVLVFVSFGTALATFTCAYRPSLQSLLAARGVGGLLWAHACTHYPVWIDRRGPPESRTLWLSGINVSILAGTLAGYVVGGAAKTGGEVITWVHLYWFEGFLMTGCGLILSLCFDSELIRIDAATSNKDANKRGKCRQNGDASSMDSTFCSGQSTPSYDSVVHSSVDVESTLSNSCEEVQDYLNRHERFLDKSAATNDDEPPLLPVVRSLFQSTPFVLSVVLSACIAGCIVFNLYFVTQYIVARGLSEREAVLAVSAVFVTSPGPGTLTGAWIVQKLGGYDDHVVTFGFALASGMAALASCALFPISRLPFAPLEVCRLLLVVACWLFFFTGGSSAAPLNGVAVSAVPNASHVASCIQFALQNAAKIVVPQLGGYVVDRIGLVDGFDITTIASVVVFILLGAFGFVHAKRTRERRHGEYEELLR